MKLIMFTIYDEKAEQFLPPFVLPQTNMAKRTFADCVADPKHAFSRNPADYTLFEVGEFNADTGHVVGREAKTSLGNGVEYLKPISAPDAEALDRQNGAMDNPLEAHPTMGNIANE